MKLNTLTRPPIQRTTAMHGSSNSESSPECPHTMLHILRMYTVLTLYFLFTGIGCALCLLMTYTMSRGFEGIKRDAFSRGIIQCCPKQWITKREESSTAWSPSIHHEALTSNPCCHCNIKEITLTSSDCDRMVVN